MKIPERLRKPGFRFVKLFGKQPFEEAWQKDRNYRWNDEELQEHLSTNRNYGVLCGKNDLLVIDSDSRRVQKAVEENLPNTFKVRTSDEPGHFHFYFFCPNYKKSRRLGKGGEFGEIASEGRQVVGPNCTHPSGTKYEIVENREIAKVEYPKLKSALKRFLKS